MSGTTYRKIRALTHRCDDTLSDLFGFIDISLDGCQGSSFQSRPGWCPEGLHRCRVLALVPVLCTGIYLSGQISSLFFLPFVLFKNSANITSLLVPCFLHVTRGALLLGKAWIVLVYSQTGLQSSRSVDVSGGPFKPTLAAESLLLGLVVLKINQLLFPWVRK